MTTQRRPRGTGGIYPYSLQGTGAVRWRIQFTADVDGESKRICRRGFRTEAKAEQALTEALDQVEAGTFGRAPKRVPPALSVWCGEWVQGLSVADSTRASYEQQIRLHISPALGRTRVDRLTEFQVRRWFNDLEGAPRTRSYCLGVLRRALGAARRQGIGPAVDPTYGVGLTRQTLAPARPEIWTATQLVAFLGFLKSTADPMFAPVHVLAHTGLRRGELLALTWADVDLGAGLLSVNKSVAGPTKSGRERTVVLDASTVAVLSAHRTQVAGGDDECWPSGDVLVFSEGDGSAVHPPHLWRAFNDAQDRYREATGDTLPQLSPHGLRHVHASLLLAAGEPVKDVAERLGHADASVTLNVYAHVMPGRGKAVADRFAELLQSNLN